MQRFKLTDAYEHTQRNQDRFLTRARGTYPHSSKGFTLLEIILAISIITLLTGSIIGISSSTLGLTTGLITAQQKELQSDDAEDHIRRNFSIISNDTRMELSVGNSTNDVGVASLANQQTLTIENPNIYFPFDGNDTLANQTRLVAVRNDKGLMDLVQVFISTPESGENDNLSLVTIISDLQAITWQFYQPSTQEWITQWDPNMGIPNQIKFSYQRIDEAEENLFIWLLSN